MAQVTINRTRTYVEGGRRTWIYNVSAPDAGHQQLQTPLHKIDSINATSKSQEAIGAQVVAGFLGNTSNQALNLQIPATPDNNIIVEVTGL